MKFDINGILAKTKKGFMDMNQAVMLALGLVVVAIVGSIGATILATNQASQTSGSYAYNISGYGLSGLNSFASQLSNVGLVGGLALILMVLFGGLYFLFAGRGRS